MTTRYYYNSNTAFDESNKWRGVVAEDANEITAQGLDSQLKKQKDFSYTVKVRIFSGLYPNAGKDQQSVDHLPFARVLSDSSGINTPIYKEGELVYGHWDNGVPVIEGKDIFSYSYVPVDKWGEIFKPPGKGSPGTLSSYSFSENGDINYSGAMKFFSQANLDLYKDIKLDFILPCPNEQNDSSVATTAIKNLIKDLESFKSGVNNFAKTEILDKIDNDQKAIKRASDFLSGWISDRIKWLQEEIMKRINGAFASASNVLPLNARFTIREGQNILIEALYCLFNKILDNLENFISDFLNELIDKFINVPLCIVEKLLLSLLSQIFGLITSVLNAISGLVGSVTGLITGIIDTIIDLLEIFSCEPTPPCPDIKEWNILEGGKSGTSSLDFGSILSSIQSTVDKFSNIAKTIYNPDTGEIIGIGIDDFSFDIAGIFNDTVSTCNGAPILCGPPKISFFGGSGSGAAGNVIVGLAGEILGVDITNGGSGYTSAPYVTIADDCGKGAGVVAYSEIKDGKVVNVVIVEPGFGYPSSPDGSLGGDGRVWAEPGQTIVIRDDGKYDTPYSPGDVIELNDKDKITYPDGTSEVIDTKDIVKVTAPQINKDDIKIFRGFYPSNNNGEYPIFLTLCDVRIVNRGGNYSPNDKIVVTPNNGAELSVTFNSKGIIDQVKVIKSGNGFTTKPEIFIESETGFNAKIVPVLCVSRIGDDKEEIAKGDIPQDQIIKVVDCVGKF